MDSHDPAPPLTLVQPWFPKPRDLNALNAAIIAVCEGLENIRPTRTCSADRCVDVIRARGHRFQVTIWAILELVDRGAVMVRDDRPRYGDGQRWPLGTNRLDADKPVDWDFAYLEPIRDKLDAIWLEFSQLTDEKPADPAASVDTQIDAENKKRQGPESPNNAIIGAAKLLKDARAQGYDMSQKDAAKAYVEENGGSLSYIEKGLSMYHDDLGL